MGKQINRERDLAEEALGRVYLFLIEVAANKRDEDKSVSDKPESAKGRPAQKKYFSDDDGKRKK